MENPQPPQPQTLRKAEKTDDQREEQRTQEKTLKCMFNTCDRVFGRKQALEIHQCSVGHGKEKLECQYANCTASFADPRSLSRHVRSVHLKQKPISCLEPGCGKKFKSKPNLQVHHCNAHGASKLACKHDNCPASFVDQSSLFQHIQSVHLKEKPFSCQEQGCVKKFGDKRDLKKHTRFVHLKEKSFSCQEQGCRKRFGTRTMLKIHTNSVHLKEKPFSCMEQGCGKKFRDKTQLKIHTNSLHLEEKTGCPKDFDSKQSQKIYVAHIHLVKKTFKCKLSTCEKKFGSKQDLEAFLRSARNGKDRVLKRGSAVTLGQRRPSKKQNRAPLPQEDAGEVAKEREADVRGPESEDQTLPEPALPEHRVAALPVTCNSVDELRDEFCIQMSPERPRAEVRSKIREEDIEEEAGVKICHYLW